jgi:peptidoglycan/LPS O-acetylase OafA/YrhL
LRAIAIALVLFTHTSAILDASTASSFFPGGFLGVDLFFVLSGFLITSLLLERRRREPRPLRTFYARRALRLLPAVVVLLAANLLYALINGGVGDALRSIVVVLAYVTNWAELAGIHISAYVTHLWSLAIEEQFYLVWPFVLFWAVRRWPSQRRLVLFALGIAALAAAWRAAMYQSGDPWLRIYIRTDTRADALAIGAALALAPWERIQAAVGARTRELAGVLALAALIVTAATVLPSAAVLYDGGFTVIAIAAAVAIACVLEPDTHLARLLSTRPFVIGGRLSYSLYLWHFGIFLIVAQRTSSWAAAPRVMLAWTLVLLLSTASYLIIERPALGLKDRLGLRAQPDRQARPRTEVRVPLPDVAAAASGDAGGRGETGSAQRAS